MAYNANVLNVMIASPGDCVRERSLIRDAISDLTLKQSESTGIVFMPRLWEVDAIAVDQLPQDAIDQQIALKADILIALFRHTLGRPMPALPDRTNTTHEIGLCRARSIPVHVYFYSGPSDDRTDPAEWAKVREYQTGLQSELLYGEFSEDKVLVAKVVQALNHDAQALAEGGQLPKPLTVEEVKQIAQGEAIVWSFIG